MRIITLMTDFGTRDAYVPSMKGVILDICPEARILDTTHDIEPGDVADGAFVIGGYFSHFPIGTVHVAVVDPGVGSSRRPIALEAGGHFFVGPDNGIFTAVMEVTDGWRAYHLDVEHYHRRPVSPVFHGRDIFAPVAAWLARGQGIGEVGTLIGDPVRHPMLPEPERDAPHSLQGRVAHLDRFGNVITNIHQRHIHGLLEGKPDGGFTLEVRSTRIRRLVRYYAEAQPGEAVALFGSSGFLEVAVNGESAAKRLSISRGDAVRLVFSP